MTDTHIPEHVDLELTGNAFWYVAPQSLGDTRLAAPGEIWIVPTPWVRIVPDRQQYVKGYQVAAPGAPAEAFSADEVIHLKYPNPLDPHYGLSPLQANALTVDANTELLKSRYQTFLAGQRPGVVLQTEQTLTDQTVSRLEEKIGAKFGGRDNWHRPLVLEQGLKASPWTLTPSAINSWVGDELRALGGEATLDWKTVAGALSLTGALFGGEVEEIPAEELHLAAGDFVVGVPREHLGERALARAVGAHDRVDLALGHLEVDPLEDLRVGVGDGRVEVADDEVGHVGSWGVCGVVRLRALRAGVVPA